MGINFPNTPAVGDKYPTPSVAGIPTYTWDGEKWTTAGPAVGVLYVAKAGDAMTGPLVLPADPTVNLQASTKQYVDAGDVAGLAAAGMQINGGMEISQESGASSRTTNGFVCDGWLFFRAGTFVINAGAPLTSSITPGISSQLYLQVATAQPSLGATDQAVIYQNMEGYRTSRLSWGSSNANSITIGFWSNHVRPGTYSVVVSNSPVTHSYATTYTHVTSAVSQFNVVTIPGPTVGTWKTDNTAGVVIYFAMAAGSSVTAPSNNAWLAGNYTAGLGQINAVAATTDVFRITGVTILPGAHTLTAAQSPLLMRPYDEELRICQRYWSKVVGNLRTGGTSPVDCTVSFPVTMRAIPTAAYLIGTRTPVDLYVAMTPGNNNYARFEIAAPGSGDSYAINDAWSMDARL